MGQTTTQVLRVSPYRHIYPQVLPHPLVSSAYPNQPGNCIAIPGFALSTRVVGFGAGCAGCKATSVEFQDGV